MKYIMDTRKTISKFLLAIVFVVNLSFSQQSPDTNLPQQEEQKTIQTQKNTAGELTLKDLSTFVEVMENLKKEYVDEVTDQQLLENAIKGMLSNLDPHSAFFNKKEFKSFSEMSSGAYSGFGLELNNDEGVLRVVSPVADSPASKAGIKPGDLIIKINNTLTQSVSYEESLKLLKNEDITEVVLTILREGKTKPFKISLKKELIKDQSVYSDMLEDGYGYIRITQFQESTYNDFSAQINELIKEYETKKKKDTANNDPAYPLNGLIIDLRNNPGGLVDQVLSICNLFLDQNLMVYTQGRTAQTRQDYMSTPGDILNRAPIVVLINAGSASASEILAGAFQDNKRALIVGERSFGKGSIQTIQLLKDGRGLKLTTARYFTPSGKSIQAHGINPDIKIENYSLRKNDQEWYDYRESDLTNHISNPSDSKEENNEIAEDNNKEKPQQLALDDYQLYEALNLLKTLFQSRKLI